MEVEVDIEVDIISINEMAILVEIANRLEIL